MARLSVGLPPGASLLGGMVAHECKHWADVLGIRSAMGSLLPNVNCTSGQIQHAESAVLADSAKVKKMNGLFGGKMRLDKYGRICPLVLIVLSDTTLEMRNTSISHRSLPVLCGYLILLITPDYFFLKVRNQRTANFCFQWKRDLSIQDLPVLWGEGGSGV